VDERDLILQIQKLLEHPDRAETVRLLSEVHPSEVAQALADIPIDQTVSLLRLLDVLLRADVVSLLDPRDQIRVAEVLTTEELAEIVAELDPDDRVDFLKRLPEERSERILPALARAEREDIRRLSAFPEGTAGSAMTSEYVAIRPAMTVSEALSVIRREAPDTETIYSTFVVSDRRELVGVVSLKDLILAHPDARVELVMDRDVVAISASASQEEAAQKIRQYDLLALPVTDDANRLVGIVTYDDAFDIVNEEFTEDLERLMAIGGTHEGRAYLRSSIWEQVSHRIGWVFVLAVLGMVSGFIVHRFEALILQFSILATFMPMLVDTGGNTGSQSATLVIRALALREVEPRDGARILLKELGVSLVLGAFLACVAFGRVFVFGDTAALPAGITPAMVGIAVGVALTIQVVTATLIGAFLPLVAARVRVDPAVIASPALTTIVDITGLLIFFTTARLILGI